MAKPKVTRTYGPIHFEDLDPHRFEDLIRELIYDYKDWQSIEATGRSGSDEGFDVRAYEKTEIISSAENENNEEAVEIHPMEGNLWMIQGKREKEIGPKKIETIISDIDTKNPPYGYILAASANFSKDSYDVFREELRKKGVMEFYLWGKAELEDMLHLPKNDRILFTFFGISLVSKRRTRATEIRSTINVKNKLYRTVGDGDQFSQSILVRDLKDIHYPYEGEYKNFRTKPRWREYVAYGHHPLGLWCHSHEYFAYIDTEKKEWDFSKEVDLVHREREDEDERQEKFEKINLVEDVWDFLPRKKQGHFVIDFLIKYADIVVVDDKGDAYYNFPHLYIDFWGDMGPFAGCRNILEIGNQEIELTKNYERISVFPKKFKKEGFGKIHKNRRILSNADSLREFKNRRLDAIYETDGRYDFLNPREVILIDNSGVESEEEYIQITHKFKAKIKDHIDQALEPHNIRRSIEVQLERKPKDNEEINVYEFRRISKWQLEQKQM